MAVPDFRHAPEGPRGYKVKITKFGSAGSKRKLDEYREQVELEQAEMEDTEAGAVVGPVIKRPKRDTLGVGCGASGRSWKEPGQRAGSLRNPRLSSSWEKKMADKAAEAAFRERKQAAAEARRVSARDARQRREAAKARKEEARSKAAVVQHVSAATARRMLKNKKGKRKLRLAAEVTE
eukprot:scaffold18.g2007.t1